MHVSRRRLTEKQQDRLAEFFVASVTARAAADLLDINRKTAAFFYHRLREIIADRQEQAGPFAGPVELDESYFGGHRKGKRGARRRRQSGRLRHPQAAAAASTRWSRPIFGGTR